MGSRCWLVFLLILAFSLLPKDVSAQSKEITQADFWAAVRSAYTATRNVFPRRETETSEGSRAGRNYRRTKTSEYVAADRFKLSTETLEGESRSVKEMIRIVKEGFCRENSNEWRTTNCYENPPAALEDAIESSFRVEKTEKAVTYTRKSTFLYTMAGKTESTKFVSEDILVLNSDLTVRERTITKSAVERGAVLSRETQKFEYGLKLKPIEPPIR